MFYARLHLMAAIGSWDTSSVTNMTNVLYADFIQSLLAAGIPAQSQHDLMFYGALHLIRLLAAGIPAQSQT